MVTRRVNVQCSKRFNQINQMTISRIDDTIESCTRHPHQAFIVAAVAKRKGDRRARAADDRHCSAMRCLASAFSIDRRGFWMRAEWRGRRDAAKSDITSDSLAVFKSSGDCVARVADRGLHKPPFAV
jgi:hypothetical protein